MKKIIVHLTESGAASLRSNRISQIGNTERQGGFQSLVAAKRGLQNETAPEDFRTVETNEIFLRGTGTLEERTARAIGFRAKNAARLIAAVEIVG